MIPGAGFIPGLLPGLEGARKNLKETEDELGELRMALRLANEQAVQLDVTLEVKQAEEGKKRLEELNKVLKEQAEILKRINDEGARREAIGRIAVPPQLETIAAGVALPTLFDPGEVAALKEKQAEILIDLNQQALQIGKKRIEEEVDFYSDQFEKTFRKIDAMNERRADEQRRQWEHMLDSIREGAGRVFDAMLTKGESVFSSLAKFAEGILQTMLRNVFQNAIQQLALTTGLGRSLRPKRRRWRWRR